MADYAKPLPRPTAETRPYWDAAKRHTLQIQRCLNCQEHYFYPRPFCPRCGGRDVEWTTVSGKGKLYSFVINYRPIGAFAADAPYVIALVDLDEGPRLMTNLVEVEPDPKAIRCDMPVEVVFDDVTPDVTLPKFRPTAGEF